jgi:hypothetical protein
MKNFARIAGLILAAIGLGLMMAFAFGIAPGGFTAGFPILFSGLLVVSSALDKPGPIQEADGAISGKRLAAFLIVGLFAGIIFKFGFENLTLWPAVVLLGMLFVVTLIFGLTTMVDIKDIMKLVKSEKIGSVAGSLLSVATQSDTTPAPK